MPSSPWTGRQATTPNSKGACPPFTLIRSSRGGASNSHYDGNAQTYMDIGVAMGEAMVELLK